MKNSDTAKSHSKIFHTSSKNTGSKPIAHSMPYHKKNTVKFCFVHYLHYLCINLVFVMKKYILTFLLTLTAMTTTYGADKDEINPWDIFVIPKVGASGSYMTQSGGEFKTGFTGGVTMQVYFTPQLAFDVELAYMQAGTNDAYIKQLTTENAGPYDYRLSYINTSYFLRYYPTRSLSLYTGVTGGRLIHAKSKYGGQSVDIKDELKGAMITVPVGVSMELGKVMLDARWSYQINKLPDSQKAKVILGNSVLNMVQLTIGYKIQIF